MKKAKCLYLAATAFFTIDLLVPIFMDLFMCQNDFVINSMCVSFFTFFRFAVQYTEELVLSQVMTIIFITIGVLTIISVVLIIKQNKNCFLLPILLMLSNLVMHIYFLVTAPLYPVYESIGLSYKLFGILLYIVATVQMRGPIRGRCSMTE